MNIREWGLRASERVGEVLPSRASPPGPFGRIRDALPSADSASRALERVPSPGEVWQRVPAPGEVWRRIPSPAEVWERLPSPAEVWRGERQPSAMRVLVSALATGTLASLLSAGVLAMLARLEGKSPLQPLNATSHWLHGPEAGQVREADLEHTAVGYAIHHASAIFWALPFHWWLESRAERPPAEIVAGAGAVAGMAAFIDYGLVPRRATPGWEHAVSPRAVAASFGALAIGLAAGGLITQALNRR